MTIFQNFLNKKSILGNSDFLSFRDKSYTVLIKYTNGETSKHENIKNPWKYKEKVLKNIYVKDVTIIPE